MTNSVELLEKEFERIRKLMKTDPVKAGNQLENFKELLDELIAERVNSFKPDELSNAAKIIAKNNPVVKN